MKYEYIVYKTTNKVNGKIYIGVHRSPIGINDGYIGNGVEEGNVSRRRRSGFPSAVAKYGYDNFERATLFSYPDTEEGKILAYKKEAEIVTRDFLKRKDVYNLCLGGKIPSSINEKEIAQYDMQGKFIQVFPSIKIASEKIGCSKSGIQAACHSNSYCCDYQWRYYKNSNEDIAPAKTRYKTVYQFDLQGNYIGYYKSASEAAKALSMRVADISAVCRGVQGQAKGYYWSFKKRFDYADSKKPIAVACYNDDGAFIKSYTSLREAAKDCNTNHGSIASCIQGKSKHAGKLRWRYFYGNTSDIPALS